MSNSLQLKFPKGQFTHTELAQLNGKTNQQVWTAYQEAIKKGIIKSAGQREGKGKPSKLWEVTKEEYANGDLIVISASTKTETNPKTSPTPKPAPKKTIPTIPVVVKETKPTIEEQVAARLKEKLSKTTEPLVVESATSEPDETLPLDAEPLPVPQKNVERNQRTLKETCPFCNKPLVAYNDATGVMVQCVQPIDICPVHENPYGHGKNEREAYRILTEKYRK